MQDIIIGVTSTSRVFFYYLSKESTARQDTRYYSCTSYGMIIYHTENTDLIMLIVQDFNMCTTPMLKACISVRKFEHLKHSLDIDFFLIKEER